MADKLNVIPLGGLGRIGKNMLVLETSDDMVVIDIGVMFPRDEMLGVDLIIPDVKYVVERQHKLRRDTSYPRSRRSYWGSSLCAATSQGTDLLHPSHP